ncbi:MAG: hypothetical protein WA610_03200 [Thermodesulfovibrionales bacterium]
MMKKIGLIIFFIFISSLAWSEVRRFDVPVGDSPQKGPKDAPVTIIEFLDFQ